MLRGRRRGGRGRWTSRDGPPGTAGGLRHSRDRDCARADGGHGRRRHGLTANSRRAWRPLDGRGLGLSPRTRNALRLGPLGRGLRRRCARHGLGGARGDGRRRRRRRSHGHRRGLGRGRLGRRRRLHRRRQEEKRVEVPLRVGRPAQAEVHVRNRVLGYAARAGGADRISLRDRRTPLHCQRSEVQERHGVAVGRLDRDRASTHRHRSGEGDDPAGRCRHGRARRRPDVYAAVETAGVGVGAEAELLQHRALNRPGPAVRARRCDERSRSRAARETPDERADMLPGLQTTATVAGGPDRCQICLQ